MSIRGRSLQVRGDSAAAAAALSSQLLQLLESLLGDQVAPVSFV
jgi:hypothetical protein